VVENRKIRRNKRYYYEDTENQRQLLFYPGLFRNDFFVRQRSGVKPTSHGRSADRSEGERHEKLLTLPWKTNNAPPHQTQFREIITRATTAAAYTARNV